MDFQPPTASRSQSRVLLQTFALRIAVATAYGHLGTLHGLSDQASTAIPRMVTLLLLPGAVIWEFVGQLLEACLIVGTRAVSGENWTMQHAVMIVLGFRVQAAEPSSNGDGTRTATYAADDVDPSCVELRLPLIRNKPPAHVNVGRGIVLLGLLAQSAASLFLITRRFSVANAALILDWSNGLYALIGICTAMNSFGILALGGREPQVIAGKVLTGPYGRELLARLAQPQSLKEGLKECFSPWFVIASAMVQSFIPRNFVKTSPLQGIESAPILWIIWIASMAVFAVWPVKGEVKETARKVSIIHDLFTGPAESETADAAQSRAAILATNEDTNQRVDGRSRDVNILVDAMYYACLVVVTSAILLWAVASVGHGAAMSAEHVLFYAAHVREQILIGSGQEELGCRIQNWTWNDPWSEKLFVY